VTQIPPRQMLRVPAAAAYLGLAESTLAKMRVRGDGPEYIRAGRKAVLYDPNDLNAWLTKNKRTSTSDAGGGSLARYSQKKKSSAAGRRQPGAA
jgi:predicted DNA-binding transcriptional regulator AlpA